MTLAMRWGAGPSTYLVLFEYIINLILITHDESNSFYNHDHHTHTISITFTITIQVKGSHHPICPVMIRDDLATCKVVDHMTRFLLFDHEK